MRVIAGKHKGKELFYPKNIRPSSQLHKKVVFDSIRPYISESIFLDLFAGSGQIGIEALSQGALHTTFVDNNKQSITSVLENILKCNIENNQYLVIQASISRYLHNNNSSFDIIYADPPYLKIQWSELEDISNILHKNSIFVLKYSPKNPPPKFPNIEIIKSKNSKDTNINFYQLK